MAKGTIFGRNAVNWSHSIGHEQPASITFDAPRFAAGHGGLAGPWSKWPRKKTLASAEARAVLRVVQLAEARTTMVRLAPMGRPAAATLSEVGP